VVTRAQVREFVERDWGRVEESKRAYWAGLAPAQRLELAGGLWQHAREHASAWPESTRAEDIAHHRRLARRLREISDALARR
jgi:hypothetical protein